MQHHHITFANEFVNVQSDTTETKEEAAALKIAAEAEAEAEGEAQHSAAFGRR